MRTPSADSIRDRGESLKQSPDLWLQSYVSPPLSDRLTRRGVHLWELNRRAGRDYDLLPPAAAIDPSEDAVSIEATYAMRASFAASGFAPAALKFFDALVELLTGAGE